MRNKNIPKQARYTGVICPECSEEMLYSDSMIFATDPPQRYIQCSGCKYNIEITKCKNCKECSYIRLIATPHSSYHYCFIKQIEEDEIFSTKFGGIISMKEVKDVNTIPKWCPLESYREK
ncbi:hypothetical protein ES708_32088 [subsurface metagenome]